MFTTVLGAKNESVLKRMTTVVHTPNMPIGSREASIYTGITIAEYLRDQGYNISLIGDSISRWVESLKGIAGDADYPAYVSSSLASFYERAGKVVCLGSPKRTGSLTIFGR